MLFAWIERKMQLSQTGCFGLALCKTLNYTSVVRQAKQTSDFNLLNDVTLLDQKQNHCSAHMPHMAG
jgi:hypothetical protein